MEFTLERYPRTIELPDETSITLRLLTAEDTEKLIVLFANVRDEDLRIMRDDVTDPNVLRHWTQTLNYERVMPIMAEVNGEFVGEVSLHRHPNTPHDNVGQIRIYVQEEFRRRGLGSQLLRDVIELGRDLGLFQLVMELFIDNAAIISAFERRGFEREAILPVYQMVVMRYDLGTRPGREVLDIDHADQLPPRREWPDLIFDSALLDIPDEFNLSDMLLDDIVARGWGERTAIYYRNEEVSYELLLGEVQRLSYSLARLGVQAGTPVLLHMPNTPQAIAANLAVQRLGALSVPTPPQFSPHELDFIAAESRAMLAITTTDYQADISRMRAATEGRLGPIVVHGLPDHAPDEQLYSYARLVARGQQGYPATLRRRNQIGLLLYTSADSGHPRGTAHRLDGLLATLDIFGRQVWRVNEEDIIGHLAPLGFAQGFVTFGLLAFRFGASVALPDDPMAESGTELVSTIRRHHITLLSASPVVYRQILADQSVNTLDLASLRLCSSGGEPLTKETYLAWEERFEQPIFEGFGTTEMLYAFLSNAVGMAPRPGSLGRVVPGYQVKVVGDYGNELSSGEIGFLMVRGPTGTLYWNDTASQHKSVRNGWNRLSDYSYMDPDGYYWFVARSDDLIKTRSYRIDPTEVEAAIQAHPRVSEVAVIGLPDEMRGQRPVAYIRPHEWEEAHSVLAQSILSSLRGRLAEYKMPDEVVFMKDALPRNAQGQLLRRVLRDQVRRQGEE
ncbi:MAG: GNAT family N-acetyltransferase [Ardenticatenales bacterium]|nr:GNAT family N-acetyltransferase [Ardenticatenales bacterium]